MGKQQLRVALLAHHANPSLTSEPLIAWNWARHLDRKVDLTLVTHVRNRGAIEAAGSLRGQVEYVDSERVARWVNKLNDRLFPSSGSVNRLVLETICQRAFDRGATRLLAGLVRSGRVDLVHRVSPISPRYPSGASGLGVPFVLGPVNGGMTTPAGFDEVIRHERQGLLKARSLAWLFDPFGATQRRSATLFAANETTRSALLADQRARTEILCENAVDIDEFEPRYARSGPRLRAVFLGRLLPYKGVQYALRALARLGPHIDVSLDVVGEGSHGGALREESKRLGLEQRVRFVGAVPRAEVPALLAGSDVLVLPSVRESGGAVVLESMAAGTPVIVADHGGPAETVAPSAGLRIPCSTESGLVQGIAAGLAHFSSNERRREELARGAREHVALHFTWEAKVERALACYRAALPRAEERATRARGHDLDGQVVLP